jgi:hypothetical protein
MKLAVFSESPADEAALRIIVEGVLGNTTERIDPPPLRSRGWFSVLQTLPVVLKHLYYRTDAQALAVVVDSDDSALHKAAHDEAGGSRKDCRLCRLRECIRQVRASLTQVAGRPPLKTAVGLAVPAIEGWYLCGRDAEASESAWARQLGTGAGLRQKRLELKRKVYGNDTPSLALEIECAVSAAHRLAKDLERLERLFPTGFGAFAKEIRTWRAAG